MPDYIEELNEGQRNAVLYNDGPSLVIAGAGSGKTRVLTYKIAYLLENGYQPWNILALTFTNKAAREMKERIARQVGPERARHLWMGTFHSMFLRILHVEAGYIGFTSQFTIYDTADSKSLIRSIIKEMGLDEKVYKPGMVQARISNAKNHLVYILVDEYQDTNFAQHSIVLQLAKNHQHVCVVGDDAQSIYSFRGADIDNILYFTKVYPDTKVFKLEQNYRSTQTIVRAANSLIEKNQWQIRKEVFSEKEKGEAIGVYQAYSDVEEGDIVVNKIAELRREKRYAYSDFAILYRTNAQSRIFEEAMRKRSMPYRIYGGLSFYQRKEIKDVIAYFRLIVNPNDEEAFKRIINYPARGIGDTTVGKIIAAATGHNVSLWTVLCEPLAYGLNFNKGTVGKLQAFRELISAFITDAAEKNAYEIGADIIRQSGIINDVCQDNSPENLSRKENIEELVNGMSDFCAQRQEEGNPNVLLGDFLSEVSLLTDQDSDKDGDDEKITLMTVHSAKGLEFKNVFVVGMEENLFPSGMVGDSPRALEEERRLFYVAITRAEEHCFLSYAKTRFRYGKMEFGSPSRFLKDIDIRFLRLPQDAGMFRRVEEEAAAFRRENARGFAPDREDAPYGGKERVSVRPKQQIIAPTVPRNLKRVAPSANTASTSPSAGGSANRVQQGQLIEHERFGLGEVLKVEGEGDNAKATIRFKNAGDKQLLLRFARFKVLS